MSTPTNDSLLLVISGPAGSGKTTLCERLEEAYPSVHRFVTTTTRRPREGEVDGRDYHFLTTDVFKEKILKGCFYEWAEIHGRYYGTEKARVRESIEQEMDLLLNIDVQGAESFRQAAQEDEFLRARLVTVFIKPASLEQIRERLVHRASDTPEEIIRRLQTARQEIPQATQFDHVIVTQDRDTDFRALRQIFETEKARRRAV